MLDYGKVRDVDETFKFIWKRLKAQYVKELKLQYPEGLNVYARAGAGHPCEGPIVGVEFNLMRREARVFVKSLKTGAVRSFDPSWATIRKLEA